MASAQIVQMWLFSNCAGCICDSLLQFFFSFLLLYSPSPSKPRVFSTTLSSVTFSNYIYFPTILTALFICTQTTQDSIVATRILSFLYSSKAINRHSIYLNISGIIDAHICLFFSRGLREGVLERMGCTILQLSENLSSLEIKRELIQLPGRSAT